MKYLYWNEGNVLELYTNNTMHSLVLVYTDSTQYSPYKPGGG